MFKGGGHGGRTEGVIEAQRCVLWREVLSAEEPHARHDALTLQQRLVRSTDERDGGTHKDDAGTLGVDQGLQLFAGANREHHEPVTHQQWAEHHLHGRVGIPEQSERQ